MSRKPLGETLWFIPDGYIPPKSSGEMESHESICVLNTGESDAKLLITIYFEDRPPIEDIEEIVPGLRTRHIRTSLMRKGDEKIPLGVPYAIKVESNIPVIVQYSRLDTTQAENALMSTLGYPIKM